MAQNSRTAQFVDEHRLELASCLSAKGVQPRLILHEPGESLDGQPVLTHSSQQALRGQTKRDRPQPVPHFVA